MSCAHSTWGGKAVLDQHKAAQAVLHGLPRDTNHGAGSSLLDDHSRSLLHGLRADTHGNLPSVIATAVSTTSQSGRVAETRGRVRRAGRHGGYHTGRLASPASTGLRQPSIRPHAQPDPQHPSVSAASVVNRAVCALQLAREASRDGAGSRHDTGGTTCQKWVPRRDWWGAGLGRQDLLRGGRALW